MFSIHNAFEVLLHKVPVPPRYFWVAYSGGLDSLVLLHVSQQIAAKWNIGLTAVHVNHQLLNQSSVWEERCLEMCQSLGIPCQTVKVRVEPSLGQSLEACAREQRYQALASFVQSQDWVLTGHHQQDQAETVLLHLIRGSGVSGLKGILDARNFGLGYLVRPLLTIPRETLEAYAFSHALSWIEDPSNQDDRFDRNYIRHKILPLIRKRWPSVTKTLSRTASHCEKAWLALTQTAQTMGLTRCVDGKKRLDISVLQKFSALEQVEIIHTWLRQQGLTVPSTRQYQHLQDDLLQLSRHDANAQVQWQGAVVKRYRQYAYAFKKQVFIPDQTIILSWKDRTQAFQLPGDLGYLIATPKQGEGLFWPEDEVLTVRFQIPGLRLRLPHHLFRLTLKKYYQTKGIPPWERNRTPLLFLKDNFLGLAGYDLSADHTVSEQVQGWVVNRGENP